MTDALWHGYDRAQLDDQDRSSGTRMPNPNDYLDRWRADSARLRAGGDCFLDVRFGPHPDEHLDVFPAKAANAPVHVFIHGGYWQSLSSKEFSFVAAGLVEAGLCVVVLNYPICPNVGMTRGARSAPDPTPQVSFDLRKSLRIGSTVQARRTGNTRRAPRPLPENTIGGGLPMSRLETPRAAYGIVLSTGSDIP